MKYQNFTFRQLNQEHISLLHLVDVRVAFFNGYAESKDEVPLSQIDRLLDTYIESSEQQREVKTALLDQIKYLYDYKDEVQEVISERVPAYPGGEKYWRFNSEHISVYEDEKTGSKFPVKGYILNADTITMRTESVMVEALLGQAEALDAYSRDLQTERVESQKMTNKRIASDIALEELRQSIIAEENQTKADIYNTIYNVPVSDNGNTE